MNPNDFIFSNRIPIRYYRHIAFWASWFVFPLLWDCLIFGAIRGEITWEKLLPELGYRFLNLVQNVAYCYPIVYYFVPKYLNKQKYISFFSLIAIFTILTYSLFLLRLWYVQDIRDPQLSLFIWNFSRSFITDGPPIVCGFFITIKILKDYYLKLEEKTILIQETSNAELQLLKAQVHPHFLFNTLNNIYSFTLNNPPKAARLVLKLSHTIKYMTDECEAEQVSLEKEIKMLHDYIGLEKVRYGNRLNLDVEITGDYENKVIAPLLLIPFVENSFKHGSSKMLEYPWIKMQITALATSLEFKLSNSKPELAENFNAKNGIGLANVQKRLNLLYPNTHVLKLNETPNSYHVHLELPLQDVKILEPDLNKNVEIETSVAAI